MSTTLRIRSVVLSLLIAAALLAFAGTAEAEIHYCQGVEATIVGSDGDDVLEGTDGKDVIVGLGGSDVIHGLGGSDLICGGRGNDKIYGGSGHDTILGKKGADIIRGGRGNDVLQGGVGNDRLVGNRGSDIASASTGSDVCRAESEHSCEMDRRWGHSVEEWRPLVEQYFGDVGQTENALAVIECESSGDPFAVNASSGVSGLFQMEMVWSWPRASQGSGWGHETVFHPEANIASARWLAEDGLNNGADSFWWHWGGGSGVGNCAAGF